MTEMELMLSGQDTGIRSSLQKFLTKYMKKTRFYVCLTIRTTLHGYLAIQLWFNVV